ncbi:hypothetical protein BJ508DRAFT_333823 [Ascobolus immersus RN42]|uniref:Uncharacterized protein n=1 Tax=Ascobolus immersus RN42 TaxID=1160509 RepID=A0A3N4HID7_ASCIM|nr:hypothetical protein BJ508DRAFT_333823 [Ascobolus immersus RN42]
MAKNNGGRRYDLDLILTPSNAKSTPRRLLPQPARADPHTPLQDRIGRLQAKREGLLQRVIVFNQRERMNYDDCVARERPRGVVTPEFVATPPPPFTLPVTFRNVAACEHEFDCFLACFDLIRKELLFNEKLWEASWTKETVADEVRRLFEHARALGQYDGPDFESYEDEMAAMKALVEETKRANHRMSDAIRAKYARDTGMDKI